MYTKYKALLETIRPYERAVVAFSGGVDSTLLSYAAAEALGRRNVLCVTARAASFPERELSEAADFCAANDIRHEVLDFDEFAVEGFSANPPDRCYRCKHALFSKFLQLAESAGIGAVFEGSNQDDENDYRPGMKAVAELGIKSPLREAGLAKNDIRQISKMLDLPTWDKQSFACLASRFVYGETITREKLEMAGRAEQFLLDRGLRSVRVRIHGTEHYTARIETEVEDMASLASEPMRGDVSGFLRKIGFTYVTLDLTGYRTGSMNEPLRNIKEI